MFITLQISEAGLLLDGQDAGLLGAVFLCNFCGVWFILLSKTLPES
jgi:hypothetical protein